MITVADLCKSFPTQHEPRVIFDRFSLNIPHNALTTFFGPNGCGKTTLLNIIAGLDSDYSGSIVGTPSSPDRIGFVFQDYRRSLLPWCTVEDNILFPLTLRGVAQREKQERLERLLVSTGVEIDRRQRVAGLSGGQAQATCILRALIIEPELLILDEPFAALDYERTVVLRRLISDVAQTMKLTVLFISHDLDEALLLGDQVVFLSTYPTRVVATVPVALPYPRTTSLTTSHDFVRLKQQSLDIFRQCIGSTTAPL